MNVPPPGSRPWEKWTPDVMAELDEVWKTDPWIVPFVGARIPPLEAGQRVLDVGCGTGRFAPLFRPADYLGVDSSPASVERARKNFPAYAFKEGDAYHLDVRDEEYPLVLNNAVLHHIPVLEPALAELWRATGKVLCTSLIVGPRNECKEQWKGFLSHMVTKERMLELIFGLRPLPHAIHLHHVDLWAHGTVIVLEKEQPTDRPQYPGERWG